MSISTTKMHIEGIAFTFPTLSYESICPSKPRSSVVNIFLQRGGTCLIYHEVYESISMSQYLNLKRAGKIHKAIPSMCILVVDIDKDVKPLRAKSCIVVLGNFKYILYQKSQRYTPALKYKSICLITIRDFRFKHTIKQGD